MNIFDVARYMRDKGIATIVITSDVVGKNYVEFTTKETCGSVTEYKAKDTDTMFQVTGNLVEGSR